MKKRAFSTPELAIVIIIIAAVIITVPYIKMNYKRQELYRNFRDIYSAINLALSMSVAENGPVYKWDFFNGNTGKIFNMYFRPYFDKPETISCDAFRKSKVTSLDGLEVFDGCDIYGEASKLDKGILKIKGATFGISEINTKNKTISAVVDINGFVQPNIIGRDIFYFKINDSIYEPYNEAGVSNQNCSMDLIPKTGVVQGTGCADRLMSEGVMNY